MEPSFEGDSVGHWDGDTLVVDTVSLKDAPWTWLNTAGHQHSDALHVVERFRPAGLNRLRVYDRRPEDVFKTGDSLLVSYAVSDSAWAPSIA